MLAAAFTLAVVIGVAYVIPDLSSTLGAVHPEFSSMQRGGQSAGSSVSWLGWIFGATVIVLIFAMFSLGVARNGSFRGAGWPLAGAFTVSILAWTGVILAYGGFVSNPQQELLFGWPLPTGLMIFVMLPGMFLVNVVFVVFFPKSILTEEDLQKFEQLRSEDDPDAGA